MDPRKVVRLMIFAAAVVLLAIVVHPPMTALLTEPLARLWWLVDSLPQRLVWIVLAALGFVLAVILGRRQPTPSPEVAQPRQSSYTEDARLAELIELSDHSIWARDVLGRRLCETAAGLRALREGVHRDQVREELLTGRWPSTRSVADVLQPRQQETDVSYISELARALDSLERYARDGDL
jgi:hypothetical protein